MTEPALFDGPREEGAGEDGPEHAVRVHLDGPEDLRALANAAGGALHETTASVHWKPSRGPHRMTYCEPPKPKDPEGGEAEVNLFGEYTEWWRNHWRSMPAFEQEDRTAWKTVEFLFEEEEWRDLFMADVIGGKLYHGKWCWYPPRGYETWSDRVWVGGDPEPRYPVYVPSKGRWESPLTIRSLERMGVKHRVVVEPQERAEYERVVGPLSDIIVTPHRDEGLTVTRNWIWDRALEFGARRFWTFDDNIDGFYRLHRNAKRLVRTGAILRAIEDFVDRYENVPIAGMQYEFFAMRREPLDPFRLNTRVYSNMLIETRARDSSGEHYRNETFYNDDTDLCLRVLKDGHCTVLFNAFLINKIATMRLDGGMTPHYQGDGRRKMAEELKEAHPDVVTVTRKWGRWQHQVDYSRFARNRLAPAVDLSGIPEEPDEYGMRLVDKERYEEEAPPPPADEEPEREQLALWEAS